METISDIADSLDILQATEKNVNINESFREMELMDWMIVHQIIQQPSTRKKVAEELDVPKYKARSKLESLFDRNLIGKESLCVSCEELIDNCKCGQYSKKIFYYRDADEEDIEMIKEIIETTAKLQEVPEELTEDVIEGFVEAS